MGKPKRRVNPTVTCSVNRDIYRLFLTELKKAVRRLPPPWTPETRGRKPHDARIVTAMYAIKEAFCLTYDEIESWNTDLIQKVFGVDRLPTHSVVHRGAQRLPMKYVRRLNKRITRRFRRKSIVVIVDSTGFRLTTSSAWYDIRIGRKNKRKDNDKLHVAIDARRGAVLDFKITGVRRHDSPQLKALLRNLRWLKRVVGDSAYLSRKNCDLVVSKNGRPVFALRKNVTSRARGSAAWKKFVQFAAENKELFEKLYHVRSFVESVFASIKRRYGSTLTAVKTKTRRTQLALRVFAYNVKQALYDRMSVTLGVPYWIKC